MLLFREKLPKANKLKTFLALDCERLIEKVTKDTLCGYVSRADELKAHPFSALKTSSRFFC